MKPLPAQDLNHVLAHAPWQELRGARLFLTGATGFFGAWLLESLCAANDAFSLGATATVLTRDAQTYLHKMPHLAARAELTWHEGDVRSFAFPQGTFTHIIHGATAASAALNSDAPREMFDVIVGGTRRVLEFAQHAGAQRFLLLSSGAIYGPQPPELASVTEDYAGAPFLFDAASAYGHGKRAAEFDCILSAQENEITIPIARCFAFVGPHLPLDAHFAAGNFLRDALQGEPIRVGGDGTPLRSYLHAADLAAWLWTILVRGQTRAYNVGSGAAVSIASLAACCAALAGSTVEIDRTPVAGALPSRYVPDVSRARNELALDTWISLDEAMRRTYAWYKSTVDCNRS